MPTPTDRVVFMEYTCMHTTQELLIHEMLIHEMILTCDYINMYLSLHTYKEMILTRDHMEIL